MEVTYREFKNIYISLTEIQKNAGRRIGDNLIWALPIEHEIKISRALKSMKDSYDTYIEAYDKIPISFGWKRMPNGGFQGQNFTEDNEPDIPKNNAQAILINAEREKIDFQLIDISQFHLPKITEKELTEMRAEFHNCPNKQYFFEYCVV